MSVAWELDFSFWKYCAAHGLGAVEQSHINSWFFYVESWLLCLFHTAGKPTAEQGAGCWWKGSVDTWLLAASHYKCKSVIKGVTPYLNVLFSMLAANFGNEMKWSSGQCFHIYLCHRITWVYRLTAVNIINYVIFIVYRHMYRADQHCRTSFSCAGVSAHSESLLITFWLAYMLRF